MAGALHGTVPRGVAAVEAPAAPVLAALTVGRTTTAGTLAWCAAVVHAGNAARPNPQAVWAGIRTALALDPAARPPAAQGALLLRQLGRVDLAERALDAGMAAWPNEPWFPWARGMIAWLDHEDPERAADWLDQAAALRCPGCPADTAHGRAAERLRGLDGAAP